MRSLTRVVIAHRISTIKDADRIIYIKNGTIRAIGSYAEIASLIPGFEIEIEVE